MASEVLEREQGGMWPWLMQRVTAVLVFVTIAIHLIVTHILNIGELSFDNIGDRLTSTALIVNDVVLLGAVLFHALNGFRMVVLDYAFAGRGRLAFDVFLWVVGTAAFVYGLWALWPWIAG